MANPEINISPIENIDINQAVGGLFSLGEVVLGLALVIGITRWGLRKMSESEKK